jgi:hypothetical protein
MLLLSILLLRALRFQHCQDAFRKERRHAEPVSRRGKERVRNGRACANSAEIADPNWIAG